MAPQVSFSICIAACLLLLSSSFVEADGPVVSTRYGTLKGKYLKVRGTERVVHTYLAVPFAKPPLGSLRLAPPQPPVAWGGERDATQQPHLCVQDREDTILLMKNVSKDMEVPEVSEDCLYLNIYTPVKPTEDTELPVMVWIHGGGFVLAGASVFDGSALAAYQNVVVVLIQYRLGLLGFFSTGDEHAPGNIGLLDQVAALQWVQENIQSFGGDPKSVTIFGESAGGVSVSLQTLSPLSAGLFHRAIAESGTARMKMLFNSNPLPVAQLLANMSGCDISSPKQIVDCIMQKSEEDLIKLQTQAKKISCGITADGVFLPKPPGEIFRTQGFHKVPFMTGVTSQEFGWLLGSYLGPAGWEKGLDREEIIPLLALLYPEPADQRIRELIVDEYLRTSKDRSTNRDRWLELMGDVMFVIPAIESASFHRDAGVPVYLYEFQHAPGLLRDRRPSFIKSDHGDEVLFVFGGPFWKGHIHFSDKFTEEEEQLSKTVMAYFGNFARTGSPNGDDLVPWPQYGQSEEYLEIGLKVRSGQHLKANRYTFLTKTLPEKIRVQREQKDHGEL
ncbi:fatty acyl-CoA hydrolase precursor, medium chain-like [Paramormyrops kingsleyae]|uniref:fatty acyl-CoA hydrolase precursor, medium chain-like n=1 Tax=Paramormyrops kingsleyae TaxID=1676925 RepID=UPI003B976BFE